MFTNWLTSDTPSSFRESLNPQPDLVIEVGPPPFSRFPAHSTVLSSQSGFFRAAISRASENGKVSENSIFLPNITVEHFTPLLTYMYTGFLELNFENIFGVLLAAHLLHMPRAVEICRDFLAHSQRQQSDFYSSAVPPQLVIPSNSAKVIRPIASKASNLGLNFVSPPMAPGALLLPSHGTPFKSFTVNDEKPLKILKLDEPAAVEVVKEHEERKTPKKVSLKPVVKVVAAALTENPQNSNESDKVIIDIASCDGPVRFRRILNDAYELNKKPLTPNEVASEMKYQQSNALSFHQQMVRNINEQYGKQKPFSSQNSEESENSQHSSDLYTCVYCNHTFKSKYCYQKHAKRHLNPLNAPEKGRDDYESSDGDVKKSTTEVKRDSIKPLDMNVQYYPCKTCGCKFPSYYFVHKHRKMCHPEIAADGSIQPIPNEESEGKLEKEPDAASSGT